MKKSLLVLAIVSIAYNSFGQTEQKFHFGLKAAPALTWFKSDTKGLNSDGSRLGFIYGLIAEFNFGKNYAFATGIDVAYRGGKFKQSVETPGNTLITSTDLRLQYIELPLTLKFKTNEIGYITYYLQAGVSMGFNIRSRADIHIDHQSMGTTQSSDSSDVDIDDSINAFNLCMVLGGGIEYSLSGNTALLAGITFSNGLLDVLDDSEAKATSNYLALTIGVLF
jgi:opacity protein-like surface antigen